MLFGSIIKNLFAYLKFDAIFEFLRQFIIRYIIMLITRKGKLDYAHFVFSVRLLQLNLA